MSEQFLMSTYGKLPVAFESGDGCWLYDTDGNKYFDTFTGVAVCGLGHTNPAVTKAIKDQCARLIHCSNGYHSSYQSKLAKKLCQISGLEKAFFCNSGAEANEAAIKLARRYGHSLGYEKPLIITMRNGFHGRTLATLSASSNPAIKKGYEPLVEGFMEVPFNDIEALEDIFSKYNSIAGVLLEPVQGEAGIFIADQEYLESVRFLCNKHKALMICDEIQCGNARTGTFFRYQAAEILPDVVTTAKGLGNGFPIAACLARGPASKMFSPGSHGTTFGGNPLACAAAMAVIDEIQHRDLALRALNLGEHILNELKESLLGADYVEDIRGCGLMIGIEMSDPCFALVPLAKAKGILLNVTSDNVIRLLPPLTMTDEEAEFLIDAVIQIIRLYAADDRAKPRN